MREFARESLLHGEGILTLTTSINPKPSLFILTHELLRKNLEIMANQNESNYIPFTDVQHLMRQAFEDLKSLSPHPADQSIVAMAKEQVEVMCLSLVRTPNKQLDALAPDLNVAAGEEVQRGKGAAELAKKIVELQREKKLTGEKYVELISNSEDANLTRAVLKLARRGVSEISAGDGNYLTVNTPLVTDQVTCDEPQTLKVQVDSYRDGARFVNARVVDFGNHAGFWRAFSDPRVDIEVLDADSQKALVLSRLIDDGISVELAVTITMPSGKNNRDFCSASLLSMPNMRDVVRLAIRRLNAQFSLDLRLPDEGPNEPQ